MTLTDFKTVFNNFCKHWNWPITEQRLSIYHEVCEKYGTEEVRRALEWWNYHKNFFPTPADLERILTEQRCQQVQAEHRQHLREEAEAADNWFGNRVKTSGKLDEASDEIPNRRPLFDILPPKDSEEYRKLVDYYIAYSEYSHGDRFALKQLPEETISYSRKIFRELHSNGYTVFGVKNGKLQTYKFPYRLR